MLAPPAILELTPRLDFTPLPSVVTQSLRSEKSCSPSYFVIPGAIFIYGAICWYNPELPAEHAGLWVAHQDGLAEPAMYGGLLLVQAPSSFVRHLKRLPEAGFVAFDDGIGWAGGGAR